MRSFQPILLTFVVAGSVNAADTTPTKFISLDACKTYYTNSVTAVAGQTADTYCADKIMTLVEACTATKISEYVTANKLTALTDLTNTEQTTLKNKFSYQCQVTAQSEAAQAKQKQVATSTSSANGSSAGSSAATKAAAATAGVAAAAQLIQVGANAINNIDKKIGAAAGTSGSANSGGPTAATSDGGASAAPTPSPTSATDTSSVAAAPPTSSANPTPQVDSSSVGQTADSSKADYINSIDAQSDSATRYASLTPEQLKTSVDEAQKAAKDLSAETAAVKNISPDLGEKADKLSGAADSSKAAVPTTDITSISKSASSKLRSEVSSVLSTASPILSAGGITPPFIKTMTILSTLQGEVNAYIADKESSCSPSAEKASFLCVEGTSPGAIAAKEMMNVAGPILSIISSAQKACSSTAKITKMVNTGLTIAKGVCVATKLVCDSMCGKSVTTIKTLSTAFQAKYEAAVVADIATGQAACLAHEAATYGTGKVACEAELKGKTTAAHSAGPKMKAVLFQENTPTTPGTSPALAIKCTSMAKDIALFAVQILGTYAAQKNAQSCADKLASSGADGSNVTTQQYCEKAENVSSQLCVCQKNSMAAGCPGALATTKDNSNVPTDEKGTNIKSLGGNAAFAGGFGSGKKTSSFGAGKLGGGSNGSGLTLGGNGEATATGALNGGYGGGGGAGAALGSLPASELGNTAAKKDAEEKKWGFGSFGGLGGSGSGFSDSGSSGGAKGKSGALSAKDEAAIKRQIASEKLAAEVSTASGKSNWEKVRNRYILKESSFILGQ